MTVYWPVVQSRLVQLLPTLPGFTGVVVAHGKPLSDADADKIVAVGYSTAADGAGSYRHLEGQPDGMRAEQGTVVCEFATRNGDSDAEDASADAFTLVAALDTSIRADQKLGVLPVSSTTDLSVDVASAQDTAGAVTRLIVSVNYFARS